MITIAGYTLNPNLVLTGLRATPVAYDLQRSEGGAAHVLVAPLDKGRLLELDGWYSSADVDMLMSIASAAMPVELVHPRGTFQVYIVDNSLEDLFRRVESRPDHREVGAIQLLEV